MRKLVSFTILGAAGVVGAGMLALPGTTAASPTDEDVAVKREDNVAELVLVADDDGDDSKDNSRTRSRTRSRNTGPSKSTRDNTRSNVTRASRDRDISRGDKTRDWTRDGGDRTRDWTQNKTNDGTRNDTRGRR